MISKKRLLLCSLIIYLLVIFIFPHSNAFAYRGGLLETASVTSSTDWKNVSFITDQDNVNTWGSTSISNAIVEWKLSAVYNLAGYYANTFGGTLHFFDDNHNLISSLIVPNGDFASGNAISLTVNNVRYVQFQAISGGTWARSLDFLGTLAPTPSSAPTGLMATSQVGSILLQWNANPETNITGYNVYMDGAKVNSSLVTSTNFTKSVSYGTSHSFYVTAMNSTGFESPSSNTVTASSSLPPVVTPVISYTAKSYNSVSLQWNNSGVSYQLYQDNVLLSTTSMTNFNVLNLSQGTTYSFKVVATDQYNRVTTSNLLLVTTDNLPIAPTGLSASSQVGSILLNWIANTDSVTGYNVYMDGLKVNTSLVTLTSYTVSVNYGLSHSFYVTAVNALSYEGLASNTVFASSNAPPAVFPTLKLDLKTYNTVNLSWDNVGNSYDVYQDSNVIASGITVTSFSVMNLNPNTSYNFKVVAKDAYSRSNDSNVLTVTTDSIPSPYIPRLFYGSLTYNSIKLLWDDLGASTYDVYRDGIKTNSTSTNYFNVYNLSASTTYNFKIVYIDKFGRIVESNVITVTMLAAPPPPPPPAPSVPPPSVVHSNNPDLNNAGDHLVQGVGDMKDKSLSLISIIILVIILVFFCLWIWKIIKRNMSKGVNKSLDKDGIKKDSVTARTVPLSVKKKVSSIKFTPFTFGETNKTKPKMRKRYKNHENTFKRRKKSY